MFTSFCYLEGLERIYGNQNDYFYDEDRLGKGNSQYNKQNDRMWFTFLTFFVDQTNLAKISFIIYLKTAIF